MIGRLTRRWSLITKFLLTLIIIVIVPIIILGIASYVRSADLLEQQMNEMLIQVADEVNHSIDAIVEDYDYLLVRMLGNKEVRDFVMTEPEDYLSRLEFMSWLETNISTDFFLKNPYALNMEICGKNGVVYSSAGSRVVKNYDFYDKIMPGDGSLSIFRLSREDGEMIALCRRMFDRNESIGIITLNIKAHEMNRIWNNVNMRNANIFIVGQDGSILYKPEGFDKTGELEAIRTLVQTEHGDSFIADIFGTSSFCVLRRSEVTGFSMLICLDRTLSLAPVNSFKQFVIGIILVMILFSVATGNFFICLILRPIRNLRDNMKQMAEGNWVRFQNIESEDEIGELMRGYNRTVSEIEHLIEQIQEKEKQQYLDYIRRQNAEMQALQSQINPHFLYNTLGTINAYAMADSMDNVQIIVDKLGRMFRYATRNALQPVCFADEIQHAGDYLTIQSLRVKCMPTVIWETEDVLKQPTLPLILQPLIENVFKHGFREGIMADSQIRISASLDQDYFIIRVKDNGIGPTEAAEDVRIPEQFEGNGIGLANVSRRIQITYGEQYGVFMSGKPGAGAEFRLIMPGKHIGPGEQRQ